MRSRLFVSAVEPCKEPGKSSGKRNNDTLVAKEEERDNRPGRQDGSVDPIVLL